MFLLARCQSLTGPLLYCDAYYNGRDGIHQISPINTIEAIPYGVLMPGVGLACGSLMNFDPSLLLKFIIRDMPIV